MKKKIGILGTGSFAREVYCHLDEIFLGKLDAIFLELDYEELKFNKLFIKNNWVPVINKFEHSSGYKQFVVGIGDPVLKKKLVGKAILMGFTPNETVIHPRALIQDVAHIGKGGIICPGVIITTNVTIEDYVIINLNATVGHDVIIKNYCTINPGVNLSGNVYLGDSCVLGTGSIVREGIRIESETVVGAQAAVVKNIVEKGVYGGVPSQKLK